jgi:protein-arginine kinase activator protein McsA
MILSKNIEIKILHNKNKYRYRDLGYDISKHKVFVLIEHLPIHSHVIVDVKCDICGTEKKIKLQAYNKNISSHNIYACNNTCAQIKNKMTSVEKFGVEHHSKTDKHRSVASATNTGIDETKREIRECKMCHTKFTVRKLVKKMVCSINCLHDYQRTQEAKEYSAEQMRNSLLKKYNVKNNFQRPDIVEKIRQTRISRHLEIPSEQLSEWKRYNREVRKLTHRNRKMLFEIWDGYDYYDKEYIRSYLELSYMNCNYPTVDHKISVFYGFKNGILPETIAGMDNLCITKRIVNSLKRIKTETEFLS